MGFAEEMQKDMQIIMSDACGFAEEVYLWPYDKEGEKFPIRGLFSAAPIAVKAGAMQQELVGNNPCISFDAQSVEALLARAISQKDILEVRGIKYQCQTPRYSSYGMLTIKLLEKGKTVKGGLLCQT